MTNIDNLIQIVGEELQEWEDRTDTDRYSIFTQNLMLAEKVSKHQHLTPRLSRHEDADNTSYHSAKSRPASEEQYGCSMLKDVDSQKTLRSSTMPANVGRPRTRGQPTGTSSQSSTADWTWRPSIPHRVSSMSTRRKQSGSLRRPDLATFHRRSCQLFSSLDSTLSSAGSALPASGRTSTSTSPSLTSSVTTQATSTLDDDLFTPLHFPSFHIDIRPEFSGDGRPSLGLADMYSDCAPRLNSRRSSSQLSPNVTSTEAIFWTSETTRQKEYAKIDAAHSGFRGFLKRFFPRSWTWAHGKRRNFHTLSASTSPDDSTGTDTDSVRRFRVSIAPETKDTITSAELAAADRNSPSVQAQAQSPRLDLETGHVSSKHVKTGAGKKRLAEVRSTEALSRMFHK